MSESRRSRDVMSNVKVIHSYSYIARSLSPEIVTMRSILHNPSTFDRNFGSVKMYQKKQK